MGAATGLVYLARPAARFNFDGVACAIAVELGEARYLVHGNHVAYGALGWLAHHAAAAAGYSGPALMTLQVLSSLLGAAGVAGFCAMLLRLGFAAPLAAAAAAGLAVSRLYWTWSLEAQVYPLGCAFLLWAAAELAGDRPRPVLVGLLQAGAVLGHVGHAMFTVPALALLPDRRSRRRYLWALCAATGAAYLVAIVFFVHPRTLDELRIWLLGSAALPVDRSFEWHGGYSLGALVDWVRVKLEFMSGGAAAGAAAWGLALWGAALAWSRRPRAAKLAVFWICSYAILYLRWQPYIVVYHYSDVPVLWLLLACAADAAGPRVGAAGGEGRIGPRARAAAVACLAAFLGVWNWTTAVRPGGDPAANKDLQRALWLGRETPEGAWVVVDQVDQVYVPYFAHRKPMNLRYLSDGPRLAARVAQARRAGEPVYAVPETIPAWAGQALEKLGWRQVSVDGGSRLFLIH